MKLKLFLFLFTLSCILYGKEVPRETAEIVARNFLATQGGDQLKSAGQVRLDLVDISREGAFTSFVRKSSVPDRGPLVYLFSVNEAQGFILVSGDDLATPVLGYSVSENKGGAELPVNFVKWIEGYKNQIRYVREHPGDQNENTVRWEQYATGKSGTGAEKRQMAVGPLLRTQWNQDPFFNDQCPFSDADNQRTVVGCVATAMAQILKYWEYPAMGAGFHSYNHERFGTISASFGSTTYDWSSMPNILNFANDAVALLSFHCGVSVDMNYDVASNGGSSAYLITERSPVTHCAEYAFREYFSYDPSLQGVIRENYTTATWIRMLKEEMDAGRPVDYAGFGSGGGHSFVCDGYDDNGFFHMNWGWGGYYDGFFSIDALDPEGLGTGGGSGGFNSGHQAIIGIQPPGGGQGGGGEPSETYDLALYEELTLSENPVPFTEAFTFHTDFANFGSADFSGQLTVAVFDEDLNFVDFAEVREGMELGTNKHYEIGLDFSNTGSLEMLPGGYTAAAFSRETGGNWQIIGDGDFVNRFDFDVTYSADIELYSDMAVTPGTDLTRGEPLTVTADILNNGESQFSGEFSIDLYDMEGQWAANVEELSVAPLDAGYFYEDVEFSSTGLALQPGTYLMALLHKPDGGDWILSGSSFNTNPIRVILKEAPVSADIYEDNDSAEDPFVFSAVFSQNESLLSSDGSTIHVGTDIDYYGLVLEQGYDYTLSARAHDSYNSGNQEIYSLDVLWSYTTTGEWSEVYDDVMAGPFTMENGGPVLFGVAPYFEGETGTYLLEIHIQRTPATSSPAPEKIPVRVYPNPATSLLYVEAGNGFDRVEIIDPNGRKLLSQKYNQDAASIDISGIPPGMYFVHVSGSGEVSIHKIVKQ